MKRRYASEEKPLLKMAKQILVAREIPEGHVLAEEDLAIKSPGDGLPPCEIGKLLGKRIKHGMGEDEDISFADLSEVI